MSTQQQGPLTISTDVYGDATHCECYGVEFCYFGDGWDAFVKFSDLGKLTDGIWDVIETYADPAPTPEARFLKDQQPGWIYIFAGGGYCKIGKSIDPDKRIRQISPKLPFDIVMVHKFYTTDIHTEEIELHRRFADKRANGEWFQLAEGDLEWLKTIG